MIVLQTIDRGLKRASSGLNAAATVVLFALMVSMTVIITAQVVARVFFTALHWTEEASRYLLVWSTMIGASIGVKRGSHIAVTFLVGLAKGRSRLVVSSVASILACAFFAFGLVYGVDLVSRTVFQTSPALRLPMRHVYLAIPIGCGLMLVHGLSNLLSLWASAGSEVR